MRALFMRAAAAAILATSLGANVAHAQHVVTEDEASKLTLEALTAPPPPPRPIYRAFYRQAMAVRYVHGRAMHVRGRGRVVEAAWHPAGRHAWHAAVHRRRR